MKDNKINLDEYKINYPNSEKVYKEALKKGLSEEEAIIEKNKVKISGSPFLKSGANMKFYEALFTILLALFITVSAL